ncbi:MAG: CBS domain-containing protein [Labilithrix sp.]|nr:CBS domain-containing protein [Labilithrix sp.]
MLCSELMKRDVERCRDSSSVAEAALSMRDHNVGFLPVSTEDEAAIGTITDRDIALRLVAEGRDPASTRVGEIMTREIISCSPNDDLAVAEERMSRHRRSRILCTDKSKRIAGVISLSAIAKRLPRGPAGTIAAAVAARESAAGEKLPRMRARSAHCREIMKTDVEPCRANDSAKHIAEIMRRRNVGFVPVCDESGAVVGAVTDRDLVLRVVAAARDPEKTSAADIMTHEVVSCSPDDPLSVVEDLMAKHKKSRIVCVDESRRPVGVVSLADIARVERFRRVARVLRDVASRPPRAA